MTLAYCEQITDDFYVFFGKDFKVVRHLGNAEAYLASDASLQDVERYREKVKELKLNIEE